MNLCSNVKVWSAAPTPFTNDWKVDHKSIERLTEHHIRLGVEGVFLCGTSGEGPWITGEMCRQVIDTTVKAADGRLKITVQVTDNSSMRILDKINQYADSGVDAVVMAPPYYQFRETQEYLEKMYLEVLDNSPLPVGYYHRGKHSSVVVDSETVVRLMEHPNLTMVKDSSGDEEVMKIFAESRKEMDTPPLLFGGNEFNSVPYLEVSYDGLLFGGGCFNGYMTNRIIELFASGNLEGAQKLQERMSSMMLEFFGGENIDCWPTGQKQVLVELGVFSSNKSIINYNLTLECENAIKNAIEREKEFLLP